MIFFLNLDGTCTRQDTDHIYQGSNNASKVIAVTSISPVQTYVQAAFTLPNGLTVGYLPMAYKGAYDVKDSTAHLWELDLAENVTEAMGTVGISFNVVNSITGTNQTSYTNTFEVEYSALPLPPPNPSQSEWEQLLDLLQSYAAVNPMIVEKLENFQIGTVTATASGTGGQPVVAAQIINQNTPNRYLLDMQFTLPRGERGPEGAFALTYSKVVELTDPPVINGSITLDSASFNRTRVVGDIVVINARYQNTSYLLTVKVEGGEDYTIIDIMLTSGERGYNGLSALICAQWQTDYNPPRIGDTRIYPLDNFTREPIIGDYCAFYIIINAENDVVLAYGRCSSITQEGYEFTFLRITGITGPRGPKGDKGDTPPGSDAIPLMDGAGSAGTSTEYSRGDHRHPGARFTLDGTTLYITLPS